MKLAFYRFLTTLTRHLGPWTFRFFAWFIAAGYFLFFPGGSPGASAFTGFSSRNEAVFQPSVLPGGSTRTSRLSSWTASCSRNGGKSLTTAKDFITWKRPSPPDGEAFCSCPTWGTGRSRPIS